jgi:hypothetical protein
VDLNGDQIPEAVLQAYDMREGCGATGNCPVWVFRWHSGEWQKILDTRDKDGIGGVELIGIEISAHHDGYRDLVLAAQDSASEQTVYRYRFHAGKYRQSGCYEADWQDPNDPTRTPFKTPLITSCRSGVS